MVHNMIVIGENVVNNEYIKDFNIDDFKTMTDFNAVSAALNKQVMENVLKPAGRKAAVGKTAVFCAAIEVGNDYFSDNDENQPFSSVPQLIPYTLDIK